jgi:hypothetical protein
VEAEWVSPRKKTKQKKKKESKKKIGVGYFVPRQLSIGNFIFLSRIPQLSITVQTFFILVYSVI